MGESKTKPTAVTAAEFIARVPDPARRADAEALVKIFARATGEPAVMWGPSIVGFGSYHYKYESGREGDMCLVGFSPRSSAMVLYARSGAAGEDARLARLGPHKSEGGCLYVKRLADLDAQVLEELLRTSAAHTREKQQCDVCVTNREAKAEKRAAAPKPTAAPVARASSRFSKAKAKAEEKAKAKAKANATGAKARQARA